MQKHFRLFVHLGRWTATALCLALISLPISGQSSNEPESQELLNGLRILIWQRPTPEVVVKLRVHSGSAFDLAGKSGEMALLGDIMFPDATTIDYFTDQMGGKLSVAVNYDSTTVTMVGKAEELDNMLDILRNAVLATQLTPDVVTRIRDARIKLIKDTAVSPSIVADRAIAVRLFGDFPYGRTSGGSAEDLARVDRADLMLARERFLNSNNATLAIVGNVNRPRLSRVLKQLFGPWRRSEQIIPNTFRAAKTPDPRVLIINVPSPSVEVRLAVRGVSRSDVDFAPALLLAKVIEDRWQTLSPDLVTKPVFARSDSHVLPGMLVIGATVNPQSTVDSILSAKKVIESLKSTPVTTAELDRARREVLTEWGSPKTENVPDPWLDKDTYKLTNPQDQAEIVRTVTATDVQRAATRIFNNANLATVVVGDPLNLKPAFQGKFEFEVLGEMPPPDQKPAASPSPTPKPVTTPSPR
jgi:zinc protease